LQRLGIQQVQDEGLSFLPEEQGQDSPCPPLQMYAFYPVQNAFWLVDFGDNYPFGVYRATLDDAMHFDELGKITYIAEAFLQPFSDMDS
jgi:hypothetical protein